MGWRADQAYEDANKQAFREWQASLSWREYAAWKWACWRGFLAGVLVVAVPATLFILLR